MRRIPLAAVLVGLALPLTAGAAEQPQVGNPEAWRRLTGEHCLACHSPASGHMSFAAIAKMPSTTSLSLHAFLLTSHPTMPNFRLTPEQIDDAVAYILALQQQ